MKRNIATYLEAIVEKSDDKIVEKFNFSKIDKINIFLTKEVLEKEYNLWFKVSDKYLSKFYEPILFSLAVHFFENNYCEDKKAKPKIGDKYQKDNKRYEVTEVDCETGDMKNATKLEPISKKDKDTLSITTTSMDGYTKLNEGTESSNRDTFKPMLKFVKKTLGICENIPSFPYKFAIVAQKNGFENCFKTLNKKAFPYAYIADGGQETGNLPVKDAMFFAASSYETIQEHIFDKDITLETIVFIGNKYNHQIQQDIDRCYFKQAIFIGEQKPDANCLKWQWTLPEYQYFYNLSMKKIETVTVENKTLSELIDKFSEYITQLEERHYIQLQQRILPYISYIYPLVIPTEDSPLKNRVDDLFYSFQKNLEQILGEEFSKIGTDYTKFYQQLVDNYRLILDQLYFEYNSKTHALKQAEETGYLLVPRGDALSIWEIEIKKLNWKKSEIISFSKLKKLSNQKTVTILSLQDYDFYCSIRDSSHQISWLFYDKEYQRYQNFVIRYNNGLIEEYKSKDRKKLIGIDYPDEIKTESVDDLMDRFWDSETDKESYTTTYQDHIDKEIFFIDGHKIKLSANSTIIFIDQQNKPKKYKVSDLSIGDEVRIYENQHKEILFDIVRKYDGSDKFNEILEHSKLWKRILDQYCANDKRNKIKEIAKLCNVAPLTVKGWLEDSNTKFPKNIKPLKNILGNNYQKIRSSSKKYNSIMIVLGRNLSDEVSDYIISKEKGRLLDRFDDNLIKAISEHNMPIRTIEKITIIDEQPE